MHSTSSSPTNRLDNKSAKKKPINPFTSTALVLHALEHGPGGVNDINRLLARYGLNATRPTISSAAEKLEKQGYIRRLPQRSYAGLYPRVNLGANPIIYEITELGKNLTWGQRQAAMRLMTR